MLEFLNIFVIEGIDIYFGYKYKVYVISKQFIIDVFEVCAKGYVEDLKGQVKKMVTLHPLQNCKIAPTNFVKD